MGNFKINLILINSMRSEEIIESEYKCYYVKHFEYNFQIFFRYKRYFNGEITTRVLKLLKHAIANKTIIALHIQ